MLPQDTLNIIRIFFSLCLFCAALFWINHPGLFSLSPSLPTAPLWVTQPPEPLFTAECPWAAGCRYCPAALLLLCHQACLRAQWHCSCNSQKGQCVYWQGNYCSQYAASALPLAKCEKNLKYNPWTPENYFIFSRLGSPIRNGVTDTYCWLFWDLQHGECSWRLDFPTYRWVVATLSLTHTSG